MLQFQYLPSYIGATHIGSSNGFSLTEKTNFSFSQMEIHGRGPYYKGAVDGDSSSPKLFIAGNVPILLGVTHIAGGASGRFVSQYITEINSLMRNQLNDPQYSLKIFDCLNNIAGGCE